MSTTNPNKPNLEKGKIPSIQFTDRLFHKATHIQHVVVDGQWRTVSLLGNGVKNDAFWFEALHSLQTSLELIKCHGEK